MDESKDWAPDVLNLKEDFEDDEYLEDEEDFQVDFKRSYSAHFKREMMKYADIHGLRKTYIKFNVSPSCIYRWRKQKAYLESCEDNRKAMSRRGPLWPELELILSKWVRGELQRGVSLNNDSILAEAQRLAKQLDVRDFHGTKSWVRILLLRNKLPWRIGSEEMSKVDQLFDFRELVRKCKFGLEEDQVCSLFEVPITIDMQSVRTVDDRPPKKERVAERSKRHFSLLLGVMESGEKLPPYLILTAQFMPKNKPNGNIVLTKSKHGWVTDAIVAHWVENVWKKRPDYNENPRMSLIIVDAAPKHQVLYSLEEMRKCSQVALIPKGLSRYAQPLNEVFEKKLTNNWQKILEELKNEGRSMAKPSLEVSARLVLETFGDISVQEIRQGFELGFRQDYDQILSLMADKLKDAP